MECPDCKSEIYLAQDVTTTGYPVEIYYLRYNDHVHDPNVESRKWLCPNGHKGMILTKKACPSYNKTACGFPGEVKFHKFE
jgi:hypothetical protein